MITYACAPSGRSVSTCVMPGWASGSLRHCGASLHGSFRLRGLVMWRNGLFEQAKRSNDGGFHRTTLRGMQPRIGLSPTLPPAGDSGFGSATSQPALGLRMLGWDVRIFTALENGS
jgi:hypothetical protein